MDAPLYPPATAYTRPQRVAAILSTQDTAISDLRAIPAVWAIVVKEMPGIEPRLAAGPLKPHLGNFSFRSLVQFGLADVAALDRIDAQLRQMGPVK